MKVPSDRIERPRFDLFRHMPQTRVLRTSDSDANYPNFASGVGFGKVNATEIPETNYSSFI
jgi:hypothetical protein